MKPTLSRRDFLSASASLASASLVGTLAALNGCRRSVDARASAVVAGPYGALEPVADLETGLPLLRLPPGFQYRSFSWAGDPMSDGQPTPSLHDGMGVIHSARHGDEIDVTLVRNHENGLSTPILAPARYDTATPAGETLPPGGGTTTLRFRGRRWVGVEASLGGTLVNCSGGITPWGSWLSCEETVRDLSAEGGRRHGYVFEVRRDPAQTTGRPIVDMGRMMHESVAVDPKTQVAYLTEDSPKKSGWYRFVPKDASGVAGSYEAGGRLQFARVAGRRNADLMTPAVGDEYALEWQDLDQPDADPGEAPEGLPSGTYPTSGPFLEAWAKGALRISRGEGICFHGGKIYLVDTEAGHGLLGDSGSGNGAVWEYDPREESLRAIFVAGSDQVGDNIDNITVSPRGGILLCEDGDPATDQYGPGTRLLGLTAKGDSYIFAKNNVMLMAEEIRLAGKQVAPRDYRGDEFAGACFDPTGDVLFVNLQLPGITFAIWGPWSRGNLG